MRPRDVKDRSASVRQRLPNLSRERGEDFQLLLSDFPIERLVYRLSKSPQSRNYVMKGAMLLRLWSDERHRATWVLVTGWFPPLADWHIPLYSITLLRSC